jgi:uncharacterized protein YdaU (DUF1376 family)
MENPEDKIDAWMPLYVRDLLADTADLSASRFGAYLRVLCHMWLERGYLAHDQERLRRLARVPSTQWPRVWRDIEKYFSAADGRLSQKRLLCEREKALKLRKARSQGGKKGAEGTWGKQRDAEQDGSAMAQPCTSPSPSPSPSPDQILKGDPVERVRDPGSAPPTPAAPDSASGPDRPSGQRPRRRKETQYSPAFEVAWSAYGRREEKVQAFVQWGAEARRVGGEEELRDRIVRALEWQRHRWAKDNWEYAPYFVRYLKRRRWEDQPPAPSSKPAPMSRPKGPPPDLCSFHREVTDRASSDPYGWCPLCRKFGARARRSGTGEPEPIGVGTLPGGGR